MWIYDFAFCCKFGEMSQIHVFRGAAQIITILHRGVIKIYYNITWGGVSWDPKFVLRNIWTAPYEYTTQSVTVRSKSRIAFKTQDGSTYGPNTFCRVSFKVISIRKAIKKYEHIIKPIIIWGWIFVTYYWRKSNVAENENLPINGDVLPDFWHRAFKVQLQRKQRRLSCSWKEKVLSSQIAKKRQSVALNLNLQVL